MILAFLIVPLTLSFAVLAFAAWYHRRDERARALVREKRASESLALAAAAAAVESAYKEWLAEGGQAFTGAAPAVEKSDDDWFPFD